MAFARVAEWVKAHRWWVTLVVIVVAGYAVGKDLALRDNARDAQVQVRGA